MNPTRWEAALVLANAAPRCMARNRRGFPCQRPASKKRKRCNLHGGAHGSGAPIGNKNRWIHGGHSRTMIEGARAVRKLLSITRELAKH